MSFSPPAPRETKSTRVAITGDGPSAHEDLTIAEQLELMRVPGEHRPGELCLLDSKGNHRRIAENAVKRFIGNYGANHSSDYLALQGTAWEDNLFSARL